MSSIDRTAGRGEGSSPLAEHPTVQQALERLQAARRLAAQRWGVGEAGSRWSAELLEGAFGHVSADGTELRARAQVVGTYDTDDGTFLWGWDHPSVPEPCAEAARAVRAWGEANARAELTEALVACTTDDAWAFTALALHLTGAEGAYCGPHGATLVFLTFSEVTVSRPGPAGGPAPASSDRPHATD